MFNMWLDSFEYVQNKVTEMEVILLERVEKLGQMGDVVSVKDGYARNFLLPQNKALRSTKSNLERFERERVQLEARNLERRQEAEALAQKVDGSSYVVIRQAGESGQLYGSVTSRDIAEAISESGVSIARSQVNLDIPIKSIGLVDIRLSLHPEVSVTVSMNVARSAEEAERQAKGEILTGAQDDFDDDEDAIEVEEVFETEELAQAAEEELAEAAVEDVADAGVDADADAADVSDEDKV